MREIFTYNCVQVHTLFKFCNLDFKGGTDEEHTAVVLKVTEGSNRVSILVNSSM